MIKVGHALTILKEMQDCSIQACVTSPPYWGLRNYGVEGQLGVERLPQEYVENLCDIFDEVKRVLKDDGVLWLNLGDSYASVHTGGSKSAKSTVGANHEGAQEIRQNKAKPKEYGLKDKDIVGVPWLVAFELQRRGWYLRTDIIWEKPNAMPESVRDRPTRSHEYIFLLTKSKKYKYYPQYEDAVTTDRRKVRSVWRMNTANTKEAHFAAYPTDLADRCILASTDARDTVLDPFLGTGTTYISAINNERDCVGIELNTEYVDIANKRVADAIVAKETEEI